MKKAKELLLFLAVLVIPLVLFILVSVLTADVISDKPNFVGFDNYIRLFLNDKMFWKALLNTILPPAIIGFLLVSAFAVVAFLVRKKIKVPRWVFYLGCVVIGGVASFVYMVYISIAPFIEQGQIYAAQTVLLDIVGFIPKLFGAITFPNILFSLYIGVVTAFVFWVLELIVDIIKNFRRKKKGN